VGRAFTGGGEGDVDAGFGGGGDVRPKDEIASAIQTPKITIKSKIKYSFIYNI
jgi:hypothetical protein